MKKVTILYVVPTAGVGGAETFILHTAKYHNREKIKAIYCFFKTGPLLDSIRNLGHDTYLVPRPPRLRNLADSWSAVKWLSAKITETRAELVHSTMAYGAIFGSLAAQRSSIPHVWFQHGPVSGWMDTLAEIMKSEMILANSNFTLHRQKNLHSIVKTILGKKKRIEVIYPGVDFDEIIMGDSYLRVRLEIRKAWGLNQDAFIVGLICRPQRQKGIHLFIESIQRLLQLNPKPEIFAVVVGGSPSLQERSSYETEMHLLAAPLGNRIQFIPSTPHPMEAISAMDIVVSASVLPEGFGLTLVEAMSMRKAVLAPNEGGPQEIVKNGENGLVYTSRDPVDFSKAMSRLFESPELCLKLGGNAYSTVHSYFNIKTTISKLENLYEEILVVS